MSWITVQKIMDGYQRDASLPGQAIGIYKLISKTYIRVFFMRDLKKNQIILHHKKII